MGVMAIRLQPRKDHLLRDGSWGTEYQQMAERLRIWETQLRDLEDKIEEIRRLMRTAEGAP